MIRLKNIKIQNIGPIADLQIKLNEHFNIICGQNGVGKTTLLECIGQSFSYNHVQNIKRKANSEKGSWSIELAINDKNEIKTFETQKFRPTEDKRSNNHGFIDKANEVIVFKTHRTFDYINLGSVNRDPVKDQNAIQNEAVTGTVSQEIKQWFVNRYLWSFHKDALEKSQLKNFEVAINCFSILDSQIRFSKVDPTSNDILLTTPQGEIYFEYLSAGFKSCLAVLLGLIKEVEYRFKDPSIFIEEFEGIIIIDEIDLHLHPEWQTSIYTALKAILPKAQVITTTHSPHIIQYCNPDELIPLVFNSAGQVAIKEIPFNNEFGFKGWSIEEILSDVMGLQSTMSSAYGYVVSDFNDALDSKNIDEAKIAYEQLNKMLHPSNTLRQLLKFQLISLESKTDDKTDKK